MPGFNPDKLNIHDLAIEEPEKQELTDVSFDPNDIFTQWDWRDLSNLALRGDDGLLYPNAALAIINKNAVPPMFSEQKEGITSQINRSLETNSLKSIAWASYISPEFTKVPAEDLEEAIKESNNKLLEFKNKNDWRHFIEIGSWLTIVGHRPNVSQEDFEKIEADFKSEKWGGELIEQGAAMSIIFPDYQLRYSKEQSDGMASFLREWVGDKNGKGGGGEWYMFAAMAKIVADKCREVNEKKQESFVQETPQMPEQRNF